MVLLSSIPPTTRLILSSENVIPCELILKFSSFFFFISGVGLYRSGQYAIPRSFPNFNPVISSIFLVISDVVPIDKELSKI